MKALLGYNLTIEVLYLEPNLFRKEMAMFLTKKFILAKVFLGNAFLATLGTVVLASALTDPDCSNRLKDCADKMRDCKDKICNRASGIKGAEEA